MAEPSSDNKAIPPSPGKKAAASNPYLKSSNSTGGVAIAKASPRSPSNPYLKSPNPKAATPAPAAVSKAPPLKTPSSDAAASTAAAASQGVSTITPELRAKVEENRKRALERRVNALEHQEPNKKARTDALDQGNLPCLRCGSQDRTSLCIKWDHDGEIQRERAFGSGPYGHDAFRYDCCGRKAPAPCYVGKHRFMGRPQPNFNMTVQCDCRNGPAGLRETKKEGKNQGRYFFRCSSDRGGCNFFMWADVAFELPPQRRQASKDGIKEWIQIYANPFQQNLEWMEMTASMMPTTQAILRERLIAAILLHECCASVTGGWVCSQPQLESFVEKIQTLFRIEDPMKRADKLLKDYLYPLKQAQVERRFGVYFGSNDPLFAEAPTFEECRDALARAMKENSILRSAGVKLERFRGQVTFIHLGGLENYYAV